MGTFPRKARALAIGLAVALSLAGCLTSTGDGSAGKTLGAPTPTLFGTAVKTPTGGAPTSTPEPPARTDVCVFPVDADESGVFTEAAIYRLQWQPGDESLIVETRGGALTLQPPVNMVAGARRLLIVHRGELPKSLQIPAALEPGGAMLFDAGTGAAELRGMDSSILSQTIRDPRGDIGGMKPALDIITVERRIAEAGDFILRLTTAAPDDGDYAWSFENIELLLGQERYARRILQSGKVVKLHYDAEGNYSVWEGTLIVQANTLTWVLNEGAELSFGARSATSATRADSTILFPVEAMRRLWQASLTSCG